MKIGRISFDVGGTAVVVENIEIENLEMLKNLVTTLIEASKFASPECYYKKVCSDFPDKCDKCNNRPEKSYFSEGRILHAPVAPK